MREHYVKGASGTFGSATAHRRLLQSSARMRSALRALDRTGLSLNNRACDWIQSATSRLFEAVGDVCLSSRSVIMSLASVRARGRRPHGRYWGRRVAVSHTTE